jgi:putative ABC transport system permease protein
MTKLQIQNIKKTYQSSEVVQALKGVSLGFRESEFVSILGPSGCGKTTMLNIIGGLDKYDNGNSGSDLIIDGVSTKKFSDSDWDAYRNNSIGFVFQSYNLIGHQTVLHNVEIAMTISGISASERKQRAKKALTDVGLSDQLNKKPNQLSGGQMQRVAIARALVNNPDIILADEPTGALDSKTSVQIMEILKKISKTKLVIMVTHNPELAEQYSTRIVRLFDGELQSDSNPLTEEESKKTMPERKKKDKFTKTSMSMMTATSLSFKNLLTKKGRTIITAIAGSIGIIGVALVLALSGGLSSYMGSMMSDTLAGFPISISTTEQTFSMGPGGDSPFGDNGSSDEVAFPANDTILRYDSTANVTRHTNILTDDYLSYIANLETSLPGTTNAITYQRSVNMNLLANNGNSVVKFETSASAGGNPMAAMMGGGNTFWQEMPDGDFVLSLYDLIGEGSRLPENKNEILLVVDEYNRLDEDFFQKLGISADQQTFTVNDFLGATMLKIVDNNDFYVNGGNMYTAVSPAQYEYLYNNANGVELTIVGIIRVKEDAGSTFFSTGFVYTTALTDYVVEQAQNSNIALAQQNSNINVLTGTAFSNDRERTSVFLSVGADTTPTGISIYPVDFDAKEDVKAYLDAYNAGKPAAYQVIYSDMAETLSDTVGTLIDTISLVLIAFACISLVVSTIMIGIITYVSVIERTKEIGILRSVGARKKDISRVFNAEALIIGFTAGSIGVAFTYALSIPINIIVGNMVGISGIAALNPMYIFLLIGGSMLLTLIAGFIPSRMAANKDPVIALRTE